MSKNFQPIFTTFAWAFFAALIVACGSIVEKPKSDLLLDPSAKRYLYVASGACYAGGVATSTGSGIITRYDLNTRVGTIIKDFQQSSTSDQPVGLESYDSGRLVTAVENGGVGRRVDFVNKDGSGNSTFISNATAFATVLRGVTVLRDGGVLVPDTVSVEKFSSGGGRITQGANAFINNPGGVCVTSNTLAVNSVQMPNGRIVFLHAAATTNNRFNVIPEAGYVAAADCLASQVGFTTTALPTAAIYHSSGYLLVAYGSTTATSNGVYAYTVNQTTNAISGATASYVNSAVLQGPSAMAEDPVTGKVYVASAAANYNTVEEFVFNPSSRTMSRSEGASFLGNSIGTRCISGMVVSN